jgi:hypothetical protein
VYSTYLGGSDSADQAESIAVDTSGNVYLTGSTGSVTFPVANAFQPTSAGLDVFVTKLNASGSALLYSSFFGGSGYESGNSIAVDSSGSAYVTGRPHELAGHANSSTHTVSIGWCIPG